MGQRRSKARAGRHRPTKSTAGRPLSPAAQEELRHLLSEGLRLQRAGEHHRAETHFQKVLKRDPGNADANHLLGLGLAQRGQLAAGIHAIGKAIKANPRVPFYHYNLGNALNMAGRHQEAVEALERALALQPGIPEMHNALGTALSQLGRHGEAASEFRRAIELKPGYAEAYSNLSSDLLASGQAEPALEAASKALTIEPGSFTARTNLGNALFLLNRFEEAAAEYERTLTLAPGSPVAEANLGRALAAAGNNAAALEHLTRALAANPEDPGLHLDVGIAWQDQSRFEEARQAFERGVALAPEEPKLRVRLGRVLAILGRFEEALEQVEAASGLDPEGVEVGARALMADIREQGEDAVLIADMQEMLTTEDLSRRDRVRLCFSLGKVLDSRGEYEAAFPYFQQGNQLKKEKPFDAAGHRAYLEALTETFTPDFYAARLGWGTGSERPIFILGMPRSGTSLTEQILASHPRVHGAGELERITEMAAGIERTLGSPYPACVTELDEGSARTLAEGYVEFLVGLAGEPGLRVTDKMPHNFLHVGLIALLFPGARIVNCRRDPMDNCLSIYMGAFKGTHAYAYDLDTLGRYYREYERLMDHWQAVSPVPILELQYEELVADLEAQARRLLDFCALDWDPGCLAFHETERAVDTPSRWQVRQPLYTRSVGRWRNYGRHLEPLREALGLDAD